MSDEGRGRGTSSNLLSTTKQLGQDYARCLLGQNSWVSRVIVHLLRLCCLAGLLCLCWTNATVITTQRQKYSSLRASSEGRIINPHAESTGRRKGDVWLERRDPSEAAIGSPLDSAVA